MIGDKSIRGARKRGFSIIELLVVISMFTVASVAITATSVNFTRVHRRTANLERLGEELRYATELVVRLARNRRIVYPPLPGTLLVPETTLSLVDASGTTLQISALPSTNAACSGLNGSCLAINVPGYGWTAVTGRNVNVRRFSVYVTPIADPFQLSGGTYANDLQPRITFVLAATYVATSTRESALLDIQTSVASRVYVR